MTPAAYLVADLDGHPLELLDADGLLICDFRDCERPDLAQAIANFIDALETPDEP